MPVESADAYRLFETSARHDRQFIHEHLIESFLEAVTDVTLLGDAAHSAKPSGE